MNSEEVLMTVNGKQMIDKELARLVKTDREQIKKAIAEAREHGDLKENAEYHAAKEKQAHIEGKILEIQSKINRARVVDTTKLSGKKIFFGATVTIYDHHKDKSTTYQIVGDDESQTSPEKISYQAPLGRALIGLEQGDTALVKAPKGDREYDIEKVSYR